MRSNQRRALAIALVAALSLLSGLSGTLVWTVDRAWQTGVWKDVQVKRAKVVFGVAPGDPDSGGRRAPPPTRETRLYVIETDDLRLELKQDATVDTPRLDVLIDQPVTFAIEKNNVYIKDAKGHETKLSLAKKTSKK